MSDHQDFEKDLLGYQPVPIDERGLDDALLQCFAGELAATPLPALRPAFLDELELQATAAELSAYTPAELREEYLETLAVSPVEADLKRLSLPALSDDLLDKFTALAEETECEVVTEKVIPFPAAEEKRRPSSWRWYTTAAAVAVIGLFTGYQAMSPQGQTPPVIVQGTTEAPSTIIDAQPIGELLNVSTNSTVINAQDQGLVPNKTNSKYYRATQVVSMETIILENEHGEKVEVKGPVRRMIYAPAVTD